MSDFTETAIQFISILFSNRYLKDLVPIFNHASDLLIGKLRKVADGKTELKMYEEFSKCTLNIIANVSIFLYNQITSSCIQSYFFERRKNNMLCIHPNILHIGTTFSSSFKLFDGLLPCFRESFFHSRMTNSDQSVDHAPKFIQMFSCFSRSFSRDLTQLGLHRRGRLLRQCDFIDCMTVFQSEFEKSFICYSVFVEFNCYLHFFARQESLF